KLENAKRRCMFRRYAAVGHLEPRTDPKLASRSKRAERCAVPSRNRGASARPQLEQADVRPPPRNVRREPADGPVCADAGTTGGGMAGMKHHENLSLEEILWV